MTRDSDIGVDASLEMQKKSDKIIARFGEVEHVFSRVGTAESATDPMVSTCRHFRHPEKEQRQSE